MSQGRVWTSYTNMPDEFKDMDQMTRPGTGWTNFVKGQPQSTVSYTDRGRSYIALERLVPPWHGGYVWVVRASICPTTATPLQPTDIETVFALLQLRTYDTQGSLRAPPAQ